MYAELCPANTLFDQSRQACYDQCHEGTETEIGPLNGLKPLSALDGGFKWNTIADDFERRPRQVKFLTGDEYADWMTEAAAAAAESDDPTRDRRQVKFGKLSHFNGKPIHTGVHKLAPRQIKFYAFPERESPATSMFGFSRQARQVKFRSLENDYEYGRPDAANDVGKKHMRRQIKFRALHSSVLVPTTSEGSVSSQENW
jgi:hypothetical protein